MRCLSCEKLSIQIICKVCQNNLLKPDFKTRIVAKDFKIYSGHGAPTTLFKEKDSLKAWLNYTFFLKPP